ncbi:MAG: M48 family metallopeptidase [Spiroplasma sp.]
MEERTLFYDGKHWQYFVDYKQQKNLYLKLKGSKIIISAPFFIKKEIIENFVHENIAKLVIKIQDYQLHHDLMISRIAFYPEPFIYFLDKKLEMISKYHKQTKFYISDDVFFIYSSLSFHNENEQVFLLKKINSFLKKFAKPIFLERLNYWQTIMNLKVATLEVRLMKNKWGVCFHKEQKITLNSKLVHFSYQVIDYVVIHELAHLVYPNHSKEFWNLVALYCPDYKSCKNILKYSNVGFLYEKD